ncbi:15332_t:CDS:10, partial [Racocetra fulgida]
YSGDNYAGEFDWKNSYSQNTQISPAPIDSFQEMEDSQERVKEMKLQLKACKEALSSKRSDLLQLWFRSQQYKEMIRILDLIEDFKGAPEKLEGLLREKHFLTASNLLLESTRMLEKKEMIGIGALSDLRRYFKAQQSKYDMTEIFSLDAPENDAQLETLRDLLWTLYSKLDAVLQGHRFILDVIERINKVRTLLRDYITNDERDSASIDAPDALLQDLMKEKKPRDSSKQLFKFGDADLKSYTVFDQQYEADIKTALQKFLPETFSKTPDERQLSVFVVDRFANTNITAGHRLVVKPDAFNVSVLFKPTSAFLEKVKTMLPPGDHRSSEDFTTFLDDFVSNVFLPQIGDKIFELFQKSTSDSGGTGNHQGISATWVQQDQLAEILGQYPYLDDDTVKSRRKRNHPTNLPTKMDDAAKMDDGKLAKQNRRWSQYGDINLNHGPKDDEKKNDDNQNTGLSLTDEMTKYAS